MKDHLEDETNKVKITLQELKRTKTRFSRVTTALNPDGMAIETVLNDAVQACTSWSFLKMAVMWKCNCQGSLTEWLKKPNLWPFGNWICHHIKEFFVMLTLIILDCLNWSLNYGLKGCVSKDNYPHNIVECLRIRL